jgi:hypothetical protein
VIGVELGAASPFKTAFAPGSMARARCSTQIGSQDMSSLLAVNRGLHGSERAAGSAGRRDFWIEIRSRGRVIVLSDPD